MIALSVVGLINLAMVLMASGAFQHGHRDVAEIGTAYHTLTPLLGASAAGFFITSLIASGISSSAVGTMAGEMIMQGFVNFRIPVWVRRFVTMIPAFVIVALGIGATKALIFSQVILSIALPVPMLALILFTARADIMGKFVNSHFANIAACTGAAVVLLLNISLLGHSLGITDWVLSFF